MGAEACQWRRQAGLSQRALETLTGLDQTTICKLERGRLPGLRLHHLARIRLACRTHKRVEPTYGRRQPTRPMMMTPESSDVGGSADLRADADDGIS
jgi:transcriptional regulator with XRE-family HTH domain